MKKLLLGLALLASMSSFGSITQLKSVTLKKDVVSAYANYPEETPGFLTVSSIHNATCYMYSNTGANSGHIFDENENITIYTPMLKSDNEIVLSAYLKSEGKDLVIACEVNMEDNRIPEGKSIDIFQEALGDFAIIKD